jgi:hypothetical protein
MTDNGTSISAKAGEQIPNRHGHGQQGSGLDLKVGIANVNSRDSKTIEVRAIQTAVYIFSNIDRGVDSFRTGRETHCLASLCHHTRRSCQPPSVDAGKILCHVIITGFLI